MNVTLFVLLVPFMFGLAGLALDGGHRDHRGESGGVCFS